MKKLTVFLMVAGMFLFCSGDLFANAIGVKVIYNKMMDDYSDAEYEDNFSGGIFFDVGRFIFDELRFRPGIDYVKLEPDEDRRGAWEVECYGIHIDWYWFFMQKGAISPFLGFGPALNYYQFDEDQTDDNDSDAGVEGFGGVEYNLSGPWTLMLELRLVLHDIADTDKRIFKPSLGVSYRF